MTGTSVAAGSEGTRNQVGMKRLLIEAQVTEFGFYIAFTERSLNMDTEVGLLARYSREVGTAQGDLRDAQIRNSLIGKSEDNRVFAGDATAIGEIGANDILSFSDLRMMDKALKDARCPKTTKLIDGSTKYGTTTVGKARYVYVGQEALPTLEDMEHNGKSVWSPVEDYAAAGTVAEGEIGRIGPFRFIEVEDMPRYVGVGADATDATDDDDVANRYTSDDETGTAHYDVFPILFVGSNSFATVGFEGDVARVTTVMPKADAYNDPYGKKGSVSISWYYGIMFLQESWIRQIACSLKVA
jgi:N4-gp56 family major capsid protein